MGFFGRQVDSSKSTFAVLITGSTFLMSSSFVAGKVLLQAGAPPMLLVGWRFLVAAVFALPLAWLEGRRGMPLLPRSSREAAVTAAIGLLQTAAVMGLLFLAMRTISASTAAILLFTNPIWVACMAPMLLGERLRRSTCAGLVLGIAGVAMAIGVGRGSA